MRLACKPVRRLFLLFAIALAAVPSAVTAGDGRVPMPTIAKGKGDTCVRDTSFMRRNHMTLLDHGRDNTVHAGVRTGREGLRECLACHAVAGRDGQPVGFDDGRHFCRACHDYTAVRVDCFECHNPRPKAGEASLKPATTKVRP